MAKNILIFSDGTGQRGGLRPDQRLTNVYKMYRAMRPGPDSPILPSDQVAFYDAGIGTGDYDGGWFRRVRSGIESAFGAGLDENVIDCYEKIIAYYEPGDRIFLFGFSRGAYTVRAVANVMNLCGVPTHLKDGAPVPRHGAKLRKIASDAVKYVYNHGAGKGRGQEPYYTEREEKGRRFRQKYGSSPPDGSPDVQGNVQPDFIGVFDTVAALNSFGRFKLAFGAIVLLLLLFQLGCSHWSLWLRIPAGMFLALLIYKVLVLFQSQIKYFLEDPDRRLRFWNPLDWFAMAKHGHWAVWNKKHYDRWLDSDVGFARHALAIDERRKDFPRVKWGSTQEAEKNAGKQPKWIKQVWFAGCHSDVGGSYPEPESRLSDIALDWMVAELQGCVPDVKLRQDLLVCAPDPLGLQHEETERPLVGKWTWLPEWLRKWPTKNRDIVAIFPLHASVEKRLAAEAVPQMDQVKPYRPMQLADHPQAEKYFQRP